MATDNLRSEIRGVERATMIIGIILGSILCVIATVVIIKKTCFMIKIKVEEKIIDYSVKINRQETVPYYKDPEVICGNVLDSER